MIGHEQYRNCGRPFAAGHCRDGAGDHVGHERRRFASYRLAKRKVGWGSVPKSTRSLMRDGRGLSIVRLTSMASHK